MKLTDKMNIWQLIIIAIVMAFFGLSLVIQPESFKQWMAQGLGIVIILDSIKHFQIARKRQLNNQIQKLKEKQNELRKS